MERLTVLVAIALLSGCMAAPPPVKIARHVLGRSVLKDARQKITGDDQDATPDAVDAPDND